MHRNEHAGKYRVLACDTKMASVAIGDQPCLLIKMFGLGIKVFGSTRLEDLTDAMWVIDKALQEDAAMQKR